MPGLGTLLNVAAIAVGASVGTLLGDRLPNGYGRPWSPRSGCSPWPWESNRPWPASATSWPVPWDGRRPCWSWAPCWPEG
jgi:hypothetical protein